MIRKMAKFSLKMNNGASIRSIEDLRKNADVESIVKYFLSGQLSLWCRTFGYIDFSEQLENVNVEFIKSIYEKLEIPYETSEIEAYLKENHGFSIENTSITSDVEEKLVADNQEIKNKLNDYVDSDIRLSDYSIEVTPVNDDNGKVIKYRITIENEKTEQYSRFVLPYDVKSNYTQKHFEDDLCKKIANALNKQHDILSYNGMKNSRYAELKKGDTFEFGVYEGKAIKWLVLTNKDGKLLALSETILCKRSFGGKLWKDSDIRLWLNNDFYNSAFNTGEKEFIQCCERTNIDGFTNFRIAKEPQPQKYDGFVIKPILTNSIIIDGIPCEVVYHYKPDNIKTNDSVFLLSGFELEYYLNDDLKGKKYIDGSWWLSSTLSSQSYASTIYKDYTNKIFIHHIEPYNSSGVRPAFWLKY